MNNFMNTSSDKGNYQLGNLDMAKKEKLEETSKISVNSSHPNAMRTNNIKTKNADA